LCCKVFNKTGNLDAVFDLTKNNKSNNKDSSPIKQVPTFQKDKKVERWLYTLSRYAITTGPTKKLGRNIINSKNKES
jgi:hypothetical protein